MPIIFEDYQRRRRNRRLATGGAVILAALSGLAAGDILSRHSTRAIQEPAQAALVPPSASRLSSRNGYTLQRPKAGERHGSSVVVRSSDACAVLDGDTLDCQGERIRLLGIDAPELPGHCRQGRACVQGDPFAASEALKQAIAPGNLRIVSVGTDRYGRTLANVYAGGRNVSCRVLADGLVAYVQRWDNDGLLAKDCPDLAH